MFSVKLHYLDIAINISRTEEMNVQLLTSVIFLDLKKEIWAKFR